MGMAAVHEYRRATVRSAVLTLIAGAGAFLAPVPYIHFFMVACLASFVLLIYRFTMWRLLLSSPALVDAAGTDRASPASPK